MRRRSSDKLGLGHSQDLDERKSRQSNGAHISMIGHAHEDELRKYLTETEQANGFGNRFLVAECPPLKILARSRGHLTEDDTRDLVQRLERAVNDARTVTEMNRSEKARRLWFDVYGELSEGKSGLLGALTGRAEAQTVRTLSIYALMDRSVVIRRKHLQVALALWAYVEASARFIFGEAIGDPLADQILQALRRSAVGLARTEISSLFQRHRASPDIARALGVLLRHGRGAVYRQAANRWSA